MKVNKRLMHASAGLLVATAFIVLVLSPLLL